MYEFDILANVTGNTQNIWGAELELFSDLNTKYTLDENLWVRGSALAERLWNRNAVG